MDYITFARCMGAFVGVSLDGAFIDENYDWNKAYYGRPVRPADILVGHGATNPNAAKLCSAVMGYVAHTKGKEAATRMMSQQGSGFIKQHQIKDLVCYCFGFTRQDIEQDLAENGRSLIAEKIMIEKKKGGCHCKDLNPKGG